MSIDKPSPNTVSCQSQLPQLQMQPQPMKNGPLPNGKSPDVMRNALPLDPSLLGKTFISNKKVSEAETGFGGTPNHIIGDSEISC